MFNDDIEVNQLLKRALEAYLASNEVRLITIDESGGPSGYEFHIIKGEKVLAAIKTFKSWDEESSSHVWITKIYYTDLKDSTMITEWYGLEDVRFMLGCFNQTELLDLASRNFHDWDKYKDVMEA